MCCCAVLCVLHSCSMLLTTLLPCRAARNCQGIDNDLAASLLAGVLSRAALPPAQPAAPAVASVRQPSRGRSVARRSKSRRRTSVIRSQSRSPRRTQPLRGRSSTRRSSRSRSRSRTRSSRTRSSSRSRSRSRSSSRGSGRRRRRHQHPTGGRRDRGGKKGGRGQDKVSAGRGPAIDDAGAPLDEMEPEPIAPGMFVFLRNSRFQPSDESPACPRCVTCVAEWLSGRVVVHSVRPND